MFKKVVTITTCVLVVVLGIFLWTVQREEQKQTQKVEELDDAKRPLSVKKNEIEQKMADLDNDYEAGKMPKATSQVIFTDLREEIYQTCYPIMKEFEYAGVLAVAWNQLPGGEGLLTVEQFRQLLDEGWTICIKWDAQTPAKEWWPKLQAQLKELNVEVSPVVYFKTGEYTRGLDAQLLEMGFSIVVHHGEESDSLIQLNDEEGIWHIGAVGFMGEKPKLRLTEAVAQKGNITYLVGFELEDEQYDERAFRSMMGYFDSYEANLELIVSDVETARQHYRDRLVAYEQAREEEYRQARAALEAELAEVEAELEKLDTQ